MPLSTPGPLPPSPLRDPGLPLSFPSLRVFLCLPQPRTIRVHHARSPVHVFFSAYPSPEPSGSNTLVPQFTRFSLLTPAQSHPGPSRSFPGFRVLAFNRLLFLASALPSNLIFSLPLHVSLRVSFRVPCRLWVFLTISHLSCLPTI